ncbi:MAG: cell wall metabolism sensor histidine kinase WalK [Chloroflexi bacterium]|nr:cell wall metabolism sensor histidine kinase WalK [Chloroflexota bacterium]
MQLKRFHWRIGLPFAILVALSLLALAIYFASVLKSNYLESLRSRLENEGHLVAMYVAQQPNTAGDPAALRALAVRQGEILDARLTFVDRQGVVLADSLHDPTGMENHLYRPEVQQALARGTGYAIRRSATISYDMLYVAVVSPELPDMIVRLAVPMSQVQADINRMHTQLGVAALIALLLVFGLAYLVTQSALRPIYHLTDAVKRMSAGELGVRVFSNEQDEIGELTKSFNLLGDSLRSTISSYEHERDRLSGLVENLVDGILIVDDGGTVRLVNPAAGRLLGRDDAINPGMALAAAVPPQVVALWRQSRDGQHESRDLLDLERASRFCQVVATPLAGSEARSTLIIVQDLTDLHRLETIRRDFTSNISHELRTPLAALKMLSETLKEGALNDPVAAHRFVDQIDMQVDSLTQMVEELLELARIESGRVPLNLMCVSVENILTPVINQLTRTAERAEIALTTEIEPGLPAIMADAGRMQRAITNLVHNGIKFTRPGGRVTVRALAQGEEAVRIEVCDTGIGINPEMIERIFERFYTADPSRAGGAGLGLSIVRHIVAAHHGTVEVQSTPNVGTCFAVILPVATTP